jgi:hypothetical protein
MHSNEPKAIEVKLKKPYKFMYENFLISSQHDLYLLLEETNGLVDYLKFSFRIYKYGYPNDEGAHLMAKYGLGFYGLFEVLNSPWITEIMQGNQLNPKHDDSLYKNYKHYIARFKDVTLEVICSEMEEMQSGREQLLELVDKELSFLKI